MATIEHPPLRPDIGDNNTRQELPPEPENLAQLSVNPLNSLLARAYTLNWEMIFYVGLFVLTVLTRFVNLGDRVMSHDESLHVKYSLDLEKTGVFQHTPLMHGPLLFHMTALMYFLFGDTDFTARLYPAILGVIMVFMPLLLFKRWLGKIGAAVASVLLLISPFILFHNRYIREDTPSIFFTLVMVYGIFAYVDGVRPRQLRWLLLLSAGMLLSLASKEVGFMYVAIFGSSLTLFWLMQVAQGIRSGETAPIVGWIIGGVVGILAWGGISYALGTALGAVLQSAGVGISPRIVQIAVAIILAIVAVILLDPLRQLLGQVGQHARSMFQLTMAGVILGSVLALGMTAVLSIVFANGATGDPVLVHRFELWTALVLVPLILLLLATAWARFSNAPWSAAGLIAVAGLILLVAVLDVPLLSRVLLWLALIGTAWLLAGNVWSMGRARLPIYEVLLVFVVMLLWGGALTIVEESGRPNGLFASAATTAAASSDTTTTTPPTAFHDEWIWGTYLVGILAVGGILYLRFGTPFFQEMKRYPVFDVLIVTGTMILPWLAAVPVFKAGYPLDGNYLTADVIIKSFIALVPFVAVSITAGLCWNPVAWIACAATFYSLFAFFYTTIFTNINGIGTGLFGSLGYWLAQQGVRRGSQPQYYYLLVELPIYEYLPVIGAMVAGVVGMIGLWRFRRERYDEAELEAAHAAEMAAAQEGEPALNPEMPNGPINPDSEMIHLSNGPVESAGPIEAAHNGPVTPVSPADATQISPANQTEVMETLERLPDEPQLAPGPDTQAPIEPAPVLRGYGIVEAERLDRLPFLAIVGYWAVMLTFAFTMAGEKMPWLTTHLTIPMIFLTGWYLGTQLEKLEGRSLWKAGWSLILLTPIMIIALANVIGPFQVGQRPFAGLERDQLLTTFTWFGAVILAGLIGYGVYQVWRRIGSVATGRTLVVGVFVLLGLLTARIAWMAAFINYNSAREFMVYAHGAPADKTIMQTIEDISKRTTDGMNLKVAYDSEISWPGTWYFRNYPNARFLGDDPGSQPDLASNVAIVVGNKGNAKVEALLGDKFYKFKYIRLWWPMQDYFDLSPERIDHLTAGYTYTTYDSNNQAVVHNVSGPELLQGIWDIWWNRDYTAYGKATGKNYDESNWPVSDPMYFYVRKDVAAQIWDFGTGATKVANPAADPFDKLNCDSCTASSVFGQEGSADGQLNHPRGMRVGPDGNLYVTDSQNARIEVFNADGTLVRQFGKAGSVDQNATGGQFREPWGVAVGHDGTIYVADTWNHRVQEFTKTGEFIRMWGTFEQVVPGSGGKPDGLWGPRDVAVDAQNQVYVADTGNKRIRVYDQKGNYLYDIGPGDATVSLNEPVGLAINDATNELYIADTWNKRVEVFDTKNRTFLRSWGVTAWGPTTESGNRPYIALDKTGSFVFVTDPDAGRVLVFDSKGLPVASFGRSSAVLGGIAVSEAGQVFVADANAGVISRYSIESLPRLVPAQAPSNGQQPKQDTF